MKAIFVQIKVRLPDIWYFGVHTYCDLFRISLKMMDIKCKLNQAFLHFLLTRNISTGLIVSLSYAVVFFLSGFSGTRYIIPMCKPINLFSGMPVSNTMICHKFFCTFKYLMSKALAANQTFVLDPKS